MPAKGGAPGIHIDGQLYREPRFLTQGEHQLVVEGDFKEILVLYSRALTAAVSWQD